MDDQGRIAPGDIVIRKADWRKGRKGPLGTVVSVLTPKTPGRGFRGPKARVKWATHHDGGTRIGGAGITSLLYCDTLQVVEVTAGTGEQGRECPQCHGARQIGDAIGGHAEPCDMCGGTGRA